MVSRQEFEAASPISESINFTSSDYNDLNIQLDPSQNVKHYILFIYVFKYSPCVFLFRLTVGSAVGSIREIFAKIKAIDAKHGKFDFVLCAGDFFGPVQEPSEESMGDDDVSQLLGGNIEGTPYTSLRLFIC